jgi:cyclophilin family peptidyl-prolyl cis-trans isomerase
MPAAADTCPTKDHPMSTLSLPFAIRRATGPVALATACLCACVACVTPTAFAAAQDAPVAAEATSEVSTLKATFDRIAKDIAKRASVNGDDRRELVALLEKVRPYAATKDPTALAMQVQIAAWIEDHALVDATYETILELNPNNDIAMAQWFQSLTRRLNYNRVLDETLARGAVVSRSTRATLAAVDALIGLNRIGEAKVRMDALSFPANERPDVTARYNTLKNRIAALAPRWQAEDAKRQAESEANDRSRVAIETTKGTITVELFDTDAPNSSAAFLDFVTSGLYVGTTFHRRVTGVGILGGDPNSKPAGESTAARGRPGTGTPGFRLPDEAALPSNRLALSGTIGFAKAEGPKPAPNAPPGPRTIPNSAGATFFILTTAAEHLNAEYTIIGRIIDGFDVACALTTSDAIVGTKLLRRLEREHTLVKAPELAPMGPAREFPELTVQANAPSIPSNVIPINPGGAVPKPR